jgi:hypothetical protein
MGQSIKEQASNKQYNDVSNFNPAAKNRFDNYQDPYSANAILGATNNATNSAVNNVNLNTKNQVGTAGLNTLRSLRSRGITDGSLVDSAVGNAGDSAMSAGANSINDLYAKNLSIMPGIYDTANKNQFATTQAGQNVDFQNISNFFNKFGIQQSAIAGLKDDTWFDDILNVANTVAKFTPYGAAASAVGAIAGGGKK